MPSLFFDRLADRVSFLSFSIGNFMGYWYNLFLECLWFIGDLARDIASRYPMNQTYPLDAFHLMSEGL